MNRTKRSFAIAGVVSLSLLGAACGSDDDGSGDTTAPSNTSGSPEPGSTARPATTAPAKLDATLNASGATFPQAFYDAAIDEFVADNKGVTINYGGGGSGKGRQDLADQLVDFAGTDAPIKDADLPTYKGGEVLYFPTVVAPVTVSYNLDVEGLKLSGPTIAKIFSAKITNWNDAAIAAENPGKTLPNQPITVVRRADSSGTTENFTKFLDASAKATGDWTLGSGSTVTWPANTQAGQGNGGVAQAVKSTKGAVGYVDYSDAVASDLSFAAVLNKAGKYVEPSIEGASAAAAGATINPNLTYSAIWAEGDKSYPIAAQTWIITYKKQADKARGTAVKEFIRYILTEGQDLAGEIDFAPLSEDLAKKALAQLDTMQLPA